jgi:capsular exopolysaccharide synthesis family protein
VPSFIIFLLKISNTKIKSINEVQLLDIPILGDLPLVKNLNSNYIIQNGDRSSLAEAYRLLRTNVNFFLSHVHTKNKTIFVTSTFSSEGKSFVSINLAKIIAMTQKKVLLIGFDVRLPKILEYLNESNNQGVTNFIINKDLDFSEIIFKSKKLEGVDIITSGIIPPNPAELLMSERVRELFTEAKNHYDYIIVDTAPVGLVTDTFLIKDFADLTIYITRLNVLEKNSLGILKEIHQGKKLNNITILVNGIDYSDGNGVRRGYGYGNYFDNSKKKNLLTRLKFKK